MRDWEKETRLHIRQSYSFYTQVCYEQTPRLPYTLAKFAICYSVLHFGYILVFGLSSQFLPLFPIQPAFNVSSGQQYL